MSPKPRSLASSFILVVLFAVAPSITASTGQSGSSGIAPVKRALLIGINNYMSNTIPQLRGSANDIETAAQILQTRFGFEPNHIRKLINENATRSAILDALNELVKNSGPDDWIYIHFSGHGSQTDDLNGDEKDGLDETLVPYDGRTGVGDKAVPDIIDDELGEILGRFRTRNVVVVLDCCHSGTGTRGITLFAKRSIPKDTRTEIYRSLQPTTRAVVPLTAQRHILLSGAAADQPALDGPIDNQYRGIFSFALMKTLAAAGTDMPAREIMRGIETELNRLKGSLGVIDMPAPQLEAESGRIDAPLFGPRQLATDLALQAKRSWLEVEVEQKTKIVLKKAVSLGAIVGSTWLIYPPGELEFAPGHGIASAQVVAIKDQDAVAELQNNPLTPISQGCRAIAVATGAAAAEIPVLWTVKSADPNTNVQQELQKLLPELKWVAPGDFARFLIVLEDARCRVFGAAGLQPLDDFTPSGTTETVQRIAQQLTRAVASADLLSLENATSNIRIEVRIPGQKAAAPGEDSRGVKAAANTTAPRFRIRNRTEPRNPGNSLQLEVCSSEDAYITIVDVDQEGGINLLFPNQIQNPDFYPNGKIRGGDPMLVPDLLADQNRARFNLDISSPPGIDTIRVFGAKDLKTAELMRQYIRTLNQSPSSRSGGQTPRAPFSQLRRDLVQIAVTRGIKVTPNTESTPNAASPSQTGDWNAASITILVEELKNP
jgi:hypothetical protein